LTPPSQRGDARRTTLTPTIRELDPGPPEFGGQIVEQATDRACYSLSVQVREGGAAAVAAPSRRNGYAKMGPCPEPQSPTV